MDSLQQLCAFAALPFKVSNRRNHMVVTPTYSGDVPARGCSHLLVLLMTALLALGLAQSPARAQNVLDAPNQGANSAVETLAVQADGKIVVGGFFTLLGGQTRNRIGRLNADGTLDTSFNPGANGGVRTLALQSDGKVVVGGEFTQLGGQTRNFIGRLNPDGTLDTSFNPGASGGISPFVSALAVQSDSKILVGGFFTQLNGQPRNNIGRLNADGTLDTSFNSGANSFVETLALQSDGKIVVGGSFSQLGGQSRARIGRLNNADGTLDTAFNPGANAGVITLAVQADGKIVVGGGFTQLGGQPRNLIGRLNADGMLDTSFIDPGAANNQVFTLAVQADGKIVVGGGFTQLGGQPRNRIGRLNADGTLDTSFNPVAGGSVRTLAVQTDGKIVVGGGFPILGGQSRNNIGRLNPNGTLVIAGLQYYALPNPVRLLDTRPGQPACNAPGTPLTGGATRTQPARIPCTGIPSNAEVVVGNATVVNTVAGATDGFITLYPSGATQPTVSNLNYVSGQVVPNAFTVGLGAGNGAFNIFASSSTHFIVDVTGYYAPPATAGLFYHPLPNPVRLLDTRPGQTACDTPGTPLTGGGTRTEPARLACTGIPANAQVVVGNATVVNTEPGAASGFITLYPSGATQPTVSNLNYVPNQIVPNAFTIGLGSGDGAFQIFASSGTHFIVDITGYYSDQATDINGAGLLYYPLPNPVRLLDTRTGQPACDAPGVPLTGNATRTQPARTACSGVAANAQAVVGNATVVNNVAGATGGFITLFPSNAAQPTVSNLNYVAGQIVPNAFTVGLGSGDGAFNIFASSSTHFIADLTGYFAP